MRGGRSRFGMGISPRCISGGHGGCYPSRYEMTLVMLVCERVKAWRDAGYTGVTRTTLELLRCWRRDGRAAR